MYQANTGAYEPPTGKCPDINLILHRYRYIERRSFLEPKQRTPRPLYFSVLPCNTSFSMKGICHNCLYMYVGL